VPVGAFLIEHILISNATAINGPEAYANQVKFLGSLPMVLFLEAFGIWLPILFHGGYGLVIWWRGESNVSDYPWTGNWMYALQRWTGIIAFAYIAWHTWHLRFAGIDLHAHPGASFGKVQSELLDTWWGGPAYMVGLIAASWHLAYGIWLFCAKWGITVGEKARQKFLVVCMLLFFVMSGVGWMSLRSFFMHASSLYTRRPVSVIIRTTFRRYSGARPPRINTPANSRADTAVMATWASRLWPGRSM
jgi:succinate dehydrogenase / fumarate reductase cytochrome b subunit